jgi:hypothetical protein
MLLFVNGLTIQKHQTQAMDKSDGQCRKIQYMKYLNQRPPAELGV